MSYRECLIFSKNSVVVLNNKLKTSKRNAKKIICKKTYTHTEYMGKGSQEAFRTLHISSSEVFQMYYDKMNSDPVMMLHLFVVS